jgi:hypothetical protein
MSSLRRFSIEYLDIIPSKNSFANFEIRDYFGWVPDDDSYLDASITGLNP